MEGINALKKRNNSGEIVDRLNDKDESVSRVKEGK
jgi:hypothetical protein